MISNICSFRNSNCDITSLGRDCPSAAEMAREWGARARTRVLNQSSIETEQTPRGDKMTDDHLSDMEAMMWNVERDPWLDPNGGGIAIYDRPLDIDRFRRNVTRAVAEVPRLRQRVAPGLGPLSTPRWVFDHEFFVLLNLAVGGGYVGPVGPDTVFPAEVLVDYVRVFERAR